MPKRIRILACGFALGVGMLLLGATAAHATPQSGAHVSGQPGGSDSASSSPSGGCRHHHYCHTPTPTPTPTADTDLHEDADAHAVEPDAHADADADQPDDRAAHARAALDQPGDRTRHPADHGHRQRTAVPTGGANTGGGGSIGGGGPNMPLVAGGAALALGSAGLGLFAYRRWRKPVA